MSQWYFFVLFCDKLWGINSNIAFAEITPLRPPVMFC
jgi:hypothetical protein